MVAMALLRQAESVEGFLKIGRPRRGNGFLALGPWVSEGEFVRVEQDARWDVSREVDQFLGLLRAVGVVAGDGKADVLEVNADLVGASGVNLRFHQRGIQ